MDIDDQFGRGVSLDGMTLAVGTWRDDGFANAASISGAVHLFTFSDAAFNGGMFAATIGHGYTGGKNLDLSGLLEAGDKFGASIDLDGTALAVGASWDDGFSNGAPLSGAVYFFQLGTPPLADWSFANTASGEVLASDIADLLKAGTAVTLQAHNDLTLNTALTVNAAGAGGALTMQAGRSLLLNGRIVTDNGDLTLIANETVAAGVLDGQRDPGNAIITMAPGTAINTGNGAVTIRLKESAGKTNAANGDIVLQRIDAAALTVLNQGASAADILLNGDLSVTGAGNSLVLASNGDFHNAAAATLNPGAGRFFGLLHRS